MRDRTDWKLCPEVFQMINSQLGPLQVDLFASRLSNQLPQYVSWRPDPGAMACDAFSLDWSQVKGYANPPWNQQSPSPESSTNTSYPPVESATVVPSTPAHVDKDSNPPTRQERPLSANTQVKQTGHLSTSSCVDYLRERYRSQILSGEALNLLLASWQQKSSKSYDSLFTKWASRCSEWNSDPISRDVSEMVNFLANLFKEGYQYRSLNAYCSVISSVHEKVDGVSVGQHTLVTRVIKAIHSLPNLATRRCGMSTKLHPTSVTWVTIHSLTFPT